MSDLPKIECGDVVEVIVNGVRHDVQFSVVSVSWWPEDSQILQPEISLGLREAAPLMEKLKALFDTQPTTR